MLLKSYHVVLDIPQARCRRILAEVLAKCSLEFEALAPYKCLLEFEVEVAPRCLVEPAWRLTPIRGASEHLTAGCCPGGYL